MAADLHGRLILKRIVRKSIAAVAIVITTNNDDLLFTQNVDFQRNKIQLKRANLISGRFDDVFKVKLFIVNVHFQKIVFNSVLIVRIKV